MKDEIAKAKKAIDQVRLLLRGQPELGATLAAVSERLRLLERGPTDADIAREFFRRFGPVKMLVGTWDDGDMAYAEASLDGRWQSGLSERAPRNEEHAAGEDGFVAALERAITLAKGGA